VSPRSVEGSENKEAALTTKRATRNARSLLFLPANAQTRMYKMTEEGLLG
jgi:hypothetical protein